MFCTAAATANPDRARLSSTSTTTADPTLYKTMPSMANARRLDYQFCGDSSKIASNQKGRIAWQMLLARSLRECSAVTAILASSKAIILTR